MPDTYDRFELRISKDRVIADAGAMGSAAADLAIPFDDANFQKDLEALRYQFRRDTVTETLAQKQRLDAHIRGRGGWRKLMREVGMRLFESLFVERVRERYSSCLDAAEREGRGLRMVLDFALDSIDALGKGEPTVSLPWEYLYDPERHFHLGCSRLTLLSRRLALPKATPPFLANLPLRILAVVATPLDAGYHEREAPRRSLEDGLRGVRSDQIQMDFMDQATFERLKQCLASHYYQVLHFIGHGYFDEKRGGLLIFEDPYGAADPVTADALAQSLRGSGVRMAFLTACLSAATAQADTFAGTAHTLVRAGVPAVIAMQYTLPVVSAFVFVRNFYQTLAAGRSAIDAATAQARLTLHGSSEAGTPRDWAIPVLYLQPETSLLARRRRRKAEESRRLIISETQIPNNLQETDILRSANFVGREDDLIRVARALRETSPPATKRRFVTLGGMGGIGKTVAAIESARWHLERGYYRDGIVWTDARDGLPLDTLLNRVGTVLGIQGFEHTKTEEKELAVRRMLAEVELLLIVDNAEGLVGQREMVDFLRGLPAQGRGKVLLTSRREFGIDGEHVELLERLALRPSLQLFAIKWGRDLSELTVEQWTLIEEISGRKLLDGHPMSIELVGSLARREGLQDLRGLEQRLRTQMMEVLKEKTATGEKVSVRASLDISYNALSKETRTLLARIAIFAGEFGESAVEAVAEAVQGWRQALEELLVASLLERRGARYVLHPVTRYYAYEKLDDKRKYHLAAAQHFVSRGAILRGADHFYEAEEWPRVVELANALAEPLFTVGLWGEARERLKKAVQAARAAGDREGEGVSLRHLGIFQANLGHVERATEYFEQALEIARETGDRQHEGNALGNLGNAYYALGQVEKAIEHHKQALVISREIGDRRGEGSDLGNLGLAYAALGQVEKAIEYHERALEIAREIRGRGSEGHQLGNLGLAYAVLGQVEKAIEYYERALEIAKEIRDRGSEGKALGNLGNAHAALGQVEKAIEYHEQALEIARGIGHRRDEGSGLGNLGLAYADLGQVEKAIEYHEQALEIAREIGDRRGEGNALGNLGNAYAAVGQVEKAIEYHKQSLVISREIGDRRGEGNALGNLGNAHAAVGQVEKAIEYYEQALEIAREIGDRQGEGNALGNLGSAYAAVGQVEKAIEYYEQALEIAREIGDRQGEGSHLINLGKVWKEEREYEWALACYLLAVEVGQAINDPRVDSREASIDALKEELGEGEFARLLQRVEPNKERIVEEILQSRTQGAQIDTNEAE